MRREEVIRLRIDKLFYRRPIYKAVLDSETDYETIELTPDQYRRIVDAVMDIVKEA